MSAIEAREEKETTRSKKNGNQSEEREKNTKRKKNRDGGKMNQSQNAEQKRVATDTMLTKMNSIAERNQWKEEELN